MMSAAEIVDAKRWPSPTTEQNRASRTTRLHAWLVRHGVHPDAYERRTRAPRGVAVWKEETVRWILDAQLNDPELIKRLKREETDRRRALWMDESV